MRQRMRINKLRNYITFQEKTNAADGLGGYTESWADVSGSSKVPAAIYDVNVNERVRQAQLEMQVTKRITIRYRSGLKSSMRIVDDDGNYLKIIGMINKDNRNVYLEFLCHEDSNA